MRENGGNKMDDKKNLANPAALGLFGLSVIALVAATELLEWAEPDSALMQLQPWIFCIGGLALLIAALLEFRRGDVFAATFFGAFGLFWFALGNPWWDFIIGWEQIGFVILGYFIFFVYMTFAAATLDMVKFMVLFFSMLMFAGLVLNVFFDATLKFAGLGALLLAIMGFYASATILLKSMAEIDVLPTGKPILKFKKIEL